MSLKPSIPKGTRDYHPEIVLKRAEKAYAKSIDSGMSLQAAMKFNPAETGSYYALLPSNKEAEPTSEPEPGTVSVGIFFPDLKAKGFKVGLS